MKHTTIFLLILSFAMMTGCNGDNNDNNMKNDTNKTNDSNKTNDYPEIEEQYKIITVPMIKREDLE